jgi:2-(1,2-epoxy-1,2-dihydrophenyl)acetyl-CoA isomerase
MAYIYEDSIFEKEEGIATLTLNLPERLNALSVGIREALLRAAEDVAQDDDTKVLIITGTGRAFCSGADVRGLAGVAEIRSGEAGRRGIMGPLSLPALRFSQLEKPVIAAVNGVAAGAGFGLAMSCDIRIASENARFISAFVRRGLPVEWGLSYFLPRAVGTAKALEIMWTGEAIDASEAGRIGLVSKVVPPDDLMNEARGLAAKLAKGPAIAIELIKRAVYAGLQSNHLASQLGYETYAAGVCVRTEDFQEGVKAFMEKREAVFKGR